MILCHQTLYVNIALGQSTIEKLAPNCLEWRRVLVDSVCQKTSQLSESKWCMPIFEWRRFIIFGRIKVILTVYRLI